MKDRTLQASLMLILGGAMWGVLWIPLREMEKLGLEGAWPSVMSFALPCLVLVPLAIYRWRIIAGQIWIFLAVMVFCGTAFSFYGVAIVLTEVNRTILLFYLTPVWGTTIGVLFLREVLGIRRVLSLICGILGLLIVLDLGIKLPWPRNAGDWMAFFASIFWAIGSAFLYRSGGVKVVDQITAFMIGGLIVTLLLIFAFGAGIMGATPTLPQVTQSVPWGLVIGLCFPIVLVFTIWPATILPPGRVGILLMTEVIFGLASAMLLLAEVLTPLQAVGAALIVAASVIEVTGTVRRRGSETAAPPAQ